MKKFGKIAKVVCAAAVVSALAAGMGVSTYAQEPSFPSAPPAMSAPANDMTIKTAKVTKITKSRITAELGELDFGDMKDGKPADKKNSTKKTDKKSADKTCTDKKSADKKGEKPEDLDLASLFKGTGKSVTITSSVKVTKDGKEAKFSDIAKGDIITVVYDKDNKITEISIGGGMGMPGGFGGGMPGGDFDPSKFGGNMPGMPGGDFDPSKFGEMPAKTN